MIDLIKSAIDKEENKDYTFFLSGDLCQMGSQRDVLNRRGIVTKQNDVYPCVRECDVKEALQVIWETRTEGWWHYKESYVKHSICTEEEFNNRLG